MHKDVEQHIRSLSDNDLLEYARTDTYLPEAIQFAKREIARRNLAADPQIVDQEHHNGQNNGDRLQL